MTERTLAERLSRVINKRLRRLIDDGSDAVERGSDEDLHALRIAVKRLRYNLEFVVPFAAKTAQGKTRDAAAPALALLSQLQECLGVLADADTFARTYVGMLDALEAGDARRAGIEHLLAEARRERERALAAVRTTWQGESNEGYPDKLATSISAAVGSLSPKPPA